MQRQIHSSNPLPTEWRILFIWSIAVIASVAAASAWQRFLRPLTVEREDCQHAIAQELLALGAARTQGNCQCLKHIVQQLDDCQRLACRRDWCKPADVGVLQRGADRLDRAAFDRPLLYASPGVADMTLWKARHEKPAKAKNQVPIELGIQHGCARPAEMPTIIHSRGHRPHRAPSRPIAVIRHVSFLAGSL